MVVARGHRPDGGKVDSSGGGGGGRGRVRGVTEGTKSKTRGAAAPVENTRRKLN